MGRKKSLTVVVCIGLVLMLAVIFLQTTEGTAQTTSQAKTLKIGHLVCLTGWYSVFDRVEERDCQILAQMINEKGGITIKGQRYNIEMVSEDGKSNLDGITAAATKLAYDDKVKFVVGPGAFFSVASSPVFERNKILHAAAYACDHPGECDSSTPYGFLGANCAIGTALVGIQAMKREYPNLKKVAIVTPDDGGIEYLIPLVKQMLVYNGYTPVGNVVGYPNEMVEFSPISTKLNSITDADIIFHQHGPPQHVGNIVKGLRELGNYKPYVASVNANGYDILPLTGKKAGTNILCTGLDPFHPGNPPMVEEVFNRRGRTLPFQMFNPNALYVILKFIQAADSLDPAVVKAKWESMDKVDTPFGPGTGVVSGDKTLGIKHHAVTHPYSYTNIKDGEVSFGGWIPAGFIP